MQDVTTKTGAVVKGRITPGKIPDAEQVPCPKASTKDTVVFHKITNVSSTKSACEYCKVEWKELDRLIREGVRANDNERRRARKTEE